MKKVIAIFTVVFLLTGCYTIYKKNSDFSSKELSVMVSPNFDFNKQKKLAVMTFKGKAYDAAKAPYFVEEEQISDMLATRLMGIGFSIVERTQLERILSEQKLSASGLLSKSDINKIGKLMDVDMLVMGNLDKNSFNTLYQTATVKFIDIETGEVLINMVCTNIFGRQYIPAMTDALMAKIK
ncbi:MAG: CsgG/HfaB family protein [Deltaproteobacteria bacterium]|nr:CsgG/HfaB family protein [Deltaproteobacteria bacterium]